MHEITPSHAEDIIAGLSVAKKVSARINTLLATPEAVWPRLDPQWQAQAVPWFNTGFSMPAHAKPALVQSILCQQARIYIQNPSSWLPVLLLVPGPDHQILDLAAAPGGKTMLLATMGAQAENIAAVESVKSRFYKLKANLRKHGAAAVRTYHKNGRIVWRYRPQAFDRLLLDAPCSSEARFTTDDESSYRFWREKKSRKWPESSWPYCCLHGAVCVQVGKWFIARVRLRRKRMNR